MELTSEESAALFGSLIVNLPGNLETLVPGLSPESIANHLLQHGIRLWQSPITDASILNSAVTAGTFALKVLLACGIEPTTETLVEALNRHNSDAARIILDFSVAKGCDLHKGRDLHSAMVHVMFAAVCDIDVFERLFFGMPNWQQFDSKYIMSGLFSGGADYGVDCSPILQFFLHEGMRPLSPMLHQAVAWGCKNSVRLLCAHGFSMADRQPYGEDTPIFCARADMVPLCVELGANLEDRDVGGATPLIRALEKMGDLRNSSHTKFEPVTREHSATVVALLKAGADITAVYMIEGEIPDRIVNNNGRSLLCIAHKTYPEDAALCDTLLFLGACPLMSRSKFVSLADITDHVNYTLLHIMREIAEINATPTNPTPMVLAKMDTSSTMGDPRNPRSLPYHRLCEWVGLLRAFADAHYRKIIPGLLERVETIDLPNIARYVELSRAGRVQAEQLCALDCGGYAEPAGKRHKK
jgi:hypothetical protein